MEDVAVVLSEQWQQLRRPVATPLARTHTHTDTTHSPSSCSVLDKLGILV